MGSRNWQMGVSRNFEGKSHANSELFASNTRPMTAVSRAGYQSTTGKSRNSFFVPFEKISRQITIFECRFSQSVFDRQCPKTRFAMEHNQRGRQEVHCERDGEKGTTSY